MKTVIVVSPFHETEQRSRHYHRTFAQLLCLRVAKAGAAPFASHLFYPQFLTEDDPADRELGLACEHGWIERCDELWIWDAWGISSGMQAAIDYARTINETGNQAMHCSYCRSLPVKMRFYSQGDVPEWNGLDQWEATQKAG